jgi:drug/metabolite transporter (DMT)-like permease
MELWIVLTLVAVLIQSGRTVLQKNLVGRLSVWGATYARFIYGLPLAWLLVAGAMWFGGHALPSLTWTFMIFAFIGSIGQILGNALFIHLIRASNFTVITTYIKTETVHGAVFTYIVLGDKLSLMGFAGVLITFVGVMVLAAGRGPLTPRALLSSFTSKDTLYGVGVGALYASASTSYRAAALNLGIDDLTLAALYTLAWVTLIQVVLMGIWMLVKQPVVLRETFRSWRVASWIGVTGIGASAAWYVAFAIQLTPYVLAVGQVELVIAWMTSHFLYKEKTRMGEIAGILVTVLGILTVVLGR